MRWRLEPFRVRPVHGLISHDRRVREGIIHHAGDLEGRERLQLKTKRRTSPELPRLEMGVNVKGHVVPWVCFPFIEIDAMQMPLLAPVY